MDHESWSIEGLLKTDLYWSIVIGVHLMWAIDNFLVSFRDLFKDECELDDQVWFQVKNCQAISWDCLFDNISWSRKIKALIIKTWLSQGHNDAKVKISGISVWDLFVSRKPKPIVIQLMQMMISNHIHIIHQNAIHHECALTKVICLRRRWPIHEIHDLTILKYSLYRANATIESFNLKHMIYI